ncbi:MAG: hypothetical protein L6Q49_11840 [Anaerolineales bacterium]|nr:hypothetical protein [Anaerolineales bacterium]
MDQTPIDCNAVNGPDTVISKEMIGLIENGDFYSKLITLRFPQDSAGSTGSVRSPELEISAGQTLSGNAGCLENALTCSVLFRIYFIGTDNEIAELWAVGEFYDGQVAGFEIPLAPLAGKTGSIVLEVSSLGATIDDNAAWINPRITQSPREQSTVTPLPTVTSTETPTRMPTSVPTSTTPPTVAPDETEPSPTPFEEFLEFIIEFIKGLFQSR